MLSFTPQVQAAIDRNRTPINFVKIEFSGGNTVYLSTAPYDIDWNGNVWLSNGILLDIEGYDRVSELRTKGTQLGLTGVDLNMAALLLPENQNNRKITIYDVFLDEVSGGVIPDPYIRDIYYIDGADFRQGTQDATIALGASGEWADFDIKKGIRTTDASLRTIHSDDRLFRYSKDVKQEIRWGGK